MALLEAAMRIGPAVSTICDHIHQHEGEAGVRRILGVLSLAKKHGSVVIEDAARPPSISASRRIGSFAAIWNAGHPCHSRSGRSIRSFGNSPFIAI